MGFPWHFPNLNIHQIQSTILVTKILHFHKQSMLLDIRVSFIITDLMEPFLYFVINFFQPIRTIINIYAFLK